MNTSSKSGGTEESIPVECQVCGTRVYVAAGLLGKRVKCPDCHTANLVKPRAAKPKPKSVLSDDDADEYRLAPNDVSADVSASGEAGVRSEKSSQATHGAASAIPVNCGICDTLMYARREHVGKKLKCPDCNGLTVVREPIAKPEDSFKLADVSDVHIEKAPPPQADEKKQEIADRIMGEATAHVAAKEAEKPIPPKSPLRDGLYTFPFYLSSLSLWILTGFGLLVNFALLVALIDVMSSGGMASILGAFLAPILAICSISLLGLVTPHLLNIIEYTAEGYDKIPEWPTEDLISRLRAVVLWGNAFAMATAPGVMLVWAIRSLGIPLPFRLGICSTFLLLPPILLSLLMNGSAFVPFSREVWRSLKTVRSAWISIWIQLACAGAIVLFVGPVVNQFAPAVADYITLFAVSIYAVFFARLVGRMGWIISQFDPTRDEPAADATDDGPDDSGLRAESDDEMGEHEIFAADES